MLNKTALAVAYLWLYLSHAPYFIRNASDPEYADEESWNDLLKVVLILSTIGYIMFHLISNRIL